MVKVLFGLPLVCMISLLGSARLQAQVQNPDQRQQFEEAVRFREQRRAQCEQLEQEFKQFDLFGASAGKPRYGLDLWGRVWILERRPGRLCRFRSLSRLEQQDYELDASGGRTFRTFFYEDNQLCVYLQGPAELRVRRLCYAPLAVVNKFAPYFRR